MFGRENTIGVLLLVLCGVVCVILINAIITGEIPTVPNGLRIPFTVAGISLSLILLVRWLRSRFANK